MQRPEVIPLRAHAIYLELAKGLPRTIDHLRAAADMCTRSQARTALIWLRDQGASVVFGQVSLHYLLTAPFAFPYSSLSEATQLDALRALVQPGRGQTLFAAVSHILREREELRAALIKAHACPTTSFP